MCTKSISLIYYSSNLVLMSFPHSKSWLQPNMTSPTYEMKPTESVQVSSSVADDNVDYGAKRSQTGVRVCDSRTCT